MGAARNDGGSELMLERWDSCSESESREGSRKGPVAARAALLSSFGSNPPWAANSGDSLHGKGGLPAKYRVGRSLHSGLEFYRAQQAEEERRNARETREARHAQAGPAEAFKAGGSRRWEGSVSRHRGAHFYAEAASRWKAAISSGDPSRVAELEGEQQRLNAIHGRDQRPADL